jgi:hypothetical protein
MPFDQDLAYVGTLLTSPGGRLEPLEQLVVGQLGELGTEAGGYGGDRHLLSLPAVADAGTAVVPVRKELNMPECELGHSWAGVMGVRKIRDGSRAGPLFAASGEG